ncbi:MAG: hypothetical protein MUF86_14075 [Akkermansiaceae bacterium]|jgi:hypothetical protein|nr:hypothetical protein [Akkermansiaceae bacterium]MCU0778774.1 hypothetical protein [Akkermansiaceae bacterium]
MSGFGLRPGFAHVIDLGVEEARARIVGQAGSDGSLCEVLSFPGFICLRIPEDRRRFWSPRLHLSLEAEGEGKTRVSGTYGPNANMWSSFLYGYLLVGSAGLFSGILGWCQAALGMRAWGLWIFYPMLAAVAGMYLLGRIGRKLGERQTMELHRLYEAAAGCGVDLC